MSRRLTNPDTHRLDPEVARAIEHHLTPASPIDAALLERVRGRVMKEVTAEVQSLHTTVRTADLNWQQVSPGVERKVLFEGVDSISVLLRIAAGTRVPGHTHPIDEECLVLEGTSRIGTELILLAGDFHVGRKGVPHADASTDTGAIVFLRESRPPETGAAA
jgi:quercetin dioxygenase-like cupin family protein